MYNKLKINLPSTLNDELTFWTFSSCLDFKFSISFWTGVEFGVIVSKMRYK